MKSPSLLFLLASLPALPLVAQQAGDPFIKGDQPASETTPDVLPAEALVRMEVFSLPHTLAHKVMRQFPKSADLYAWLDAELKKEKSDVKQEHLSALKVRSGQRSKLESIDEYPYPTEFDPGQIPQTVGLGMSAGSGGTTIDNPSPQPKPVPPPAPTPAPMPAPAPKPEGAEGDRGPAGAAGKVYPPLGSIPASLELPPYPFTPTTPNSFMVTNLGWTSEIELTISEDGKTVDMQIAPESKRLTGIVAACPSGEVENPTFDTARLSTQIIAKMGRPQFAGTFSRPLRSGVEASNEENRVRLLFLTPLKPAPELPAPAAPNPAPEIRTAVIHYDTFSLSLPAARTAMLAHPKEQDLYKWLDETTERGDSGVTLEFTHSQVVRGGQLSSQHAIQEYPYPTEMDPPQIPQTISLPLNAAATPADAAGEHLYPAFPRTGLAPNSLTFRNLGWSADAELSFSENGISADMTLSQQYCRLVSTVAWGIAREALQPVFETQKVTSQISAVLNQPTLISTFSPPVNTGAPGGNTVDRVWFLFVTVTEAE